MKLPSAVKYSEAVKLLLCCDYDSPYTRYWLAMLSYTLEYVEDTGYGYLRWRQDVRRLQNLTLSSHWGILGYLQYWMSPDRLIEEHRLPVIIDWNSRTNHWFSWSERAKKNTICYLNTLCLTHLLKIEAFRPAAGTKNKYISHKISLANILKSTISGPQSSGRFAMLRKHIAGSASSKTHYQAH